MTWKVMFGRCFLCGIPLGRDGQVLKCVFGFFLILLVLDPFSSCTCGK